MIDLVVVAAGGRLGALVCAEAEKRPALLRVAARIGRNDSLASSLGALAHGSGSAGGACVIDLATAGATVGHARACAEARVPYLVATTGLGVDDERALADASRTIAVLSAANLSLSAHVAARMVREASARLHSYDVEVVEVHHKRKKDAPSGTALMLAASAADGRAQDVAAPGVIKRGRDGVSPRVEGEIGVSAVRGGDVVGEHTVFFLGEGERIDVTHRITDRAVFARGALAAAQFLVDKPAGRYAMSDVID